MLQAFNWQWSLGAYFQDINGELGNLTKPKPLGILMRLISYGPNPIKLFEITTIWHATGFGFNQNGRVELSARASVLSFDISSKICIILHQAFCRRKWMPIGAIFRGDLDLTVHNRNVAGNIHATWGS